MPRSAWLAAASPALFPIAIAMAIAGCAHDPDRDPACATSTLTYDTFGAAFVANWCRGCHSDQVPAGMRQNAPVEINFDTREQIVSRSDRIAIRAGTGATMPPAGGPSADERLLLVEWLTCGAP